MKKLKVAGDLSDKTNQIYGTPITSAQYELAKTKIESAMKKGPADSNWDCWSCATGALQVMQFAQIDKTIQPTTDKPATTGSPGFAPKLQEWFNNAANTFKVK